MRKLNLMIAAGALAVPMALGTSGIAMADVAADSSGVQNQVETSQGNSSDDGDSGSGELGREIRDAFGVGDDEDSNENSDGDNSGIFGDEDDSDSGIFGDGDDSGDDGGSDEDGILQILEEIFGGGDNSDGGNSGGDNGLLG
jgi:hypothetical protein